MAAYEHERFADVEPDRGVERQGGGVEGVLHEADGEERRSKARATDR